MRRSFFAFALLLAALGHAQQPNAVQVTCPGNLLPRIAPQYGEVMFPRLGSFVLKPHGDARNVAHLLREKGFAAKAFFERTLNRAALGEDGPDYMEAYRDMVHDRTYPYQSVDPLRIAAARKTRDKMPVWNRSTGGQKSPTGTWAFIGPTNMPVPYAVYYGTNPISGRVNDCAFDPNNSSIYYIATATGGIWKTVNAGTNWTFMSQSWADLHSSAVAVDPSNSNIIYAGTGDVPGDQFGILSSGYGIQKSTDGGMTWTLKGNLTFQGRSVADIWVDPITPLNIVVTTGNDGDGSIFRSTNGGDSWTRRTTFSGSFSSLSYSANRPGLTTGYLYAASNGGFGGAILRSTNLGSSWTLLTPPSTSNEPSQCIAASKISSEVVYVLSPGDMRIYKSTTAGSSWFNTTNDFPTGGSNYNWGQTNYNYYISTSSKTVGGIPQDVIYIGTIDVVKSTNGGGHWTSYGSSYDYISSRIHNDQHAGAVNPSNADEILLGNDGGVYKYTESTNNLRNLNRTLGITQFYYMDWDDNLANVALGGAQDNSTAWWDAGVWRNVIGGDGGGAWIDPRNRAVMFGSDQTGLNKTDTSWTFRGGVGFGWGSEPHWNVPLVEPDPNNPDKVYTATNYLYRIDNVFLGAVTKLAGPNCADGIRCVKVARGDSNRIYTGNSGQLFMTTDGGSSWTNIMSGSPSLPNLVVMDISTNPANPSDIVVVFGGFGSPHVWRCTDTTAASRVWADVSGRMGATSTTRLPDIQTNCIARDLDDPANVWFIGTDLGVFMTTNAGADWFNATAPLGLPNVPVTDMESVANTRFLNVATFGRGAWRIQLTNIPTPAISSLVVSPLTNYEGRRSVATVTLVANAPFPGLDVTLGTVGPISSPTSIHFEPGVRSVDFTLNYLAVSSQTTATLTATLNGVPTSVNPIVRPSVLSHISLSQYTLFGGAYLYGRVHFLGSSAAGKTVSLSTASLSVKIPSSVVVPKGKEYADFTIQTYPVPNDEKVQFQAWFKQVSVFAVLDLFSPQVRVINVDKPKYIVGDKGTLTVWLTSPAPAGGTKVFLTSSFSDALDLPPSILIGEGASELSVEFHALKPVDSLTVNAVTTRDIRTVKFAISNQ